MVSVALEVKLLLHIGEEQCGHSSPRSMSSHISAVHNEARSNSLSAFGERASLTRRWRSHPGREAMPGRATRKRVNSSLTCPRAGVRWQKKTGRRLRDCRIQL